MDLIFIEGVAAVVSSILVFCGGIWLLLMMVMGARLAYFVSASVTLAFLLIMGVVWSLPAINPLGPVGQLPEWHPVAIAETAEGADFGPAGQYPEGDWYLPDAEDAGDAQKTAELKNGASDYLETALDDGDLETFEAAGDALATEGSQRFLEQDGKLYGAVAYEPAPGAEGTSAVAFLEYDPGNPLGPARQITLGFAVLLGLHMFGLSRSEAKARKRAEVLGVP